MINTNILVYSQYHGTITITFDAKDEVSRKADFREYVYLSCSSTNCRISFLNQYKNLSYFFSRALNNTDKIKSISITKFKIISNNLKGMFRDCKSVTKISGLELINTSEVADMSEMFCWYNKFLEFDISSFNTSLVKNMSHMFYNVPKETIGVSNFNTSLVENMSNMFGKEQNFHEGKVTGLVGFDTSKVTHVFMESRIRFIQF